ncbi:MAG: hypothetical protein IKU66_07420 [Clostridia bacterium]|nr:hypothetical protein [Clostridia bacterium]
MDNIKLWMLSLCGATALTAIFRILLSDSNLKKVINVFSSVFILFYTVTPLNSLISEHGSGANLFEYQTYNDEFLISGYEETIKKSIEFICDEKSVNIIDFQIESYFNDDNLYVNSLEIDIDDNSKISEIENIINKQLGYEVNVK